MMGSQPIIFTDLDGTLLDHETYSFSAALPAIELIKKREIPLVLCSSKTRAEIEYWRKRLENRHPFISENGGGIFVPFYCFTQDDISSVWPKAKMVDGYHELVLGTPYPVLREALEDFRIHGFGIKGFGDMSAGEVAQLTGLSGKEAQLAKKREFDEPFFFQEDQRRFKALLVSVRNRGLRCAQGRIYHLMGDNDKGKAMELLTQLYQRKFADVITIALGDSPVDLPMLEKADYPVLVRNHRGEHDRGISLSNLIKAEGIGPKGWNDIILKLIEKGT